MSADRPDPDALLLQVQAEEARARRGKLRIFFGASAGVGKTFAMLAAARAARAQGQGVLVGIVETHGRAETEAMARDLPLLPRKQVPYRDRVLEEFDLDGALAHHAAHPCDVLLLDELAHSNAAGSRHPKRWQDVEELLEAGVDVWTTMNVQHLESLNDIVSGITGIRVFETVPDRVFDEADEVVVVDLPPDELLVRLKQGKVYLPAQAERAAANFFRKGNLLALRELTLRRTADRIDDEVQAYRKSSAIEAVWPNREALLACIGPDEHGEKVVRSCARLAAQLDVAWHAVHVQTAASASMSAERRNDVLRVLKLAQELGATTATLSAPEVAPALARYARDHNLVRMVVGRRALVWRWPWRRSVAEQVAALAGELDVLEVALPRATAAASSAPAETPRARFEWRGYAAAVAICGAVTALAAPFAHVFELSSLVLVFLLAVVVTAMRFGRGPAVLAAALSVLLFNVFFVPPLFSLEVADERFFVTFAVMLVVGLLVAHLTAGLKAQSEASTERERGVRSLYEMSRELGGALIVEQVAAIAQRFVTTQFSARATLLVADAEDRLVALPGDTAEADIGVAHWAFERARPAGRGTDTLPAAASLMLPLKAPMRVRGVLAVQQQSGAPPWSPEEQQLLDTGAMLLAISLERIHYIEVAQSTTVQVESERLRNSLLSAISHDLRTPLASLVGLADTLELATPAQRGELVRAIRDSAFRMNALVNNLLDMARLESGTLRLDRQWQPFEEVVGSALAACASVLAGRPVDVALADDLPLLRLDAVLIERVLANLLENAAKYTPPGTPIRIGASLAGERVAITVEDRGPGLPRGKEEALFQKFERGRKESATSGVGLGLAICRAIVEAHGGTIRAENVETGGARFVITLPKGEPPADLGANAMRIEEAGTHEAGPG
jgi:two-component system sensor histidine kinase KdpD